MSLTVTFFGTRGSIPAPGPGTVRYGGNTPCLLVATAAGEVILDAGTGLRALGGALAARERERPVDVEVLLTHTHWDHIQGLPFFQPLFHRGNRVAIYGPRQAAIPLATVLDRQMDPSVFPVPLSDLQAEVEVTEIGTEELALRHFDVATFEACHPGSTLGYAVRARGHRARLVYLTDNELHAIDETGRRPALVRFLRDTDLLVHDATYFAAQAHEHRGWGHSSAVEAVRIAVEGDCRRLVLFHHHPDHDDDVLDRLLDEAQAALEALGGAAEIVIAAEGSTLDVEDS